MAVIANNNNVVAVGETRLLTVAGVKQNFSLDWDTLDIESQAEAEYEQHSVLVVREIYSLSR